MSKPDKRKLVLIGAGSAVFTRGLVADLIVDGSPWDLCLVDINPEALETALLLAQKMVEARGAPITLSAHTDRRAALPSADFVVTTIAVGGRRGWESDVFIPRRHGIFQPVGDTIMPGGISRGMRQVPAMLAIARDVAALAPGARLFNYANPMAIICRAVQKATGLGIVGLCHGVKDGERGLARMLGVELSRCRFSAVGINHLTFFVEFTVDGRDAWPLVRQKLLAESPQPSEYFRRALFLECGAYSVLNDRHLTEFFPQFFRDGRHPGGTLGVDIFSFEGTIAGGDRGYAAMADQARGRAPLDQRVFQRQPGEHEQLVDILRSLTADMPARYSVNIPNEGQVENLPRGAVLECPAEVDACGIRPVPMGQAAPFVRSAVLRALATVEIAAEAAIRQDKQLFLEALVTDGSVSSMEQARALADELWEANARYLAEIQEAL